MRIAVVHNRYQEFGGEDVVVAMDVARLRERGHDVLLYEVDNDEGSGVGRLTAVGRAVWSRRAAEDLAAAVARFRPDVAHVHNHAYRLSAAVYPALTGAGVPVVATLHNYRMLCANAVLLRDGRVCTDCVGGRAALHGIQHRCFRDSASASAMVVGMQLAYRRAALPVISRWLTPSAATRDLFVSGGFPAAQVFVHANATDDPGERPGREPGPVVLFAGRLSPEKGVATLLRAWRDGIAGGELRLAGAGEPTPGTPPSVTWLGSLSRDELHDEMRRARAVVVPSEWPEVFGLVAVEALACGTPVVATDAGALPEIVTPGCGWLVPTGDVGALRTALGTALTDRWGQRSLAARQRYEEHYTLDTRIDALLAHYDEVRNSPTPVSDP